MYSFRNSIRTQMLAFLGALLLILLILLNTLPMIFARDAVFKEKNRSMSSQAAVISSSISGLNRLTYAGVSEALDLLDVVGYSRILVTDASGTIIYAEGAGGIGTVVDEEDIYTALGGKTVFRSDYTGDSFQSSYAIPVARQGVITGALCISEEDPEQAELIVGLQERIRNISIAVALGAGVIAVIFLRFLVRRISALVSSMRVVATGDYSHRHAVKGKDEIAELGEEFNQLTERLQENEQQRRRFVSDASHELKTPLASIRLLSDSIVQNEMDAGTMREFVTDIGTEAMRLQRTTEKLLDLSRLDDDVHEMPVPVDVKQVTMDALSVLAPLAAEKTVRIHTRLDDGCVVMATGDDMFHIIFNLMENAVKYNVPEGTVTVRCEKQDGNVVITVEDTGIGIPEGDRLNIFTRFYRVDKARSRESGGSGLGLSIVHDAVAAHGGSIAVGENRPQGSRFVVTFPEAREEETGI